MKQIRLFLLIILFLTLVNANTIAQITPSVYTGIGTGTNLGGMVGIGGEIQYKFFSLNAAVGIALDEQIPQSHTGDKSIFDYDFGIKLHSKIGIFGGVNYGLIDAVLSTKRGQDVLHLKKTHGFSYTVGYKHTIYKHIYGLTYLGLTSNKDANRMFPPFFDKRGFLPRMGLIIGYEFNSMKFGKQQ
jgi:hypothetical protein